jgi:trehalose 6-phosphate phosphatase
MRFIDSGDLLDVCVAEQAWSVFLDLDGALVDVDLDPGSVVLPKRFVPGLLGLKARLGDALAIVSGRTIESVDRILAPGYFDVAGLHGAELRFGNARFTFGLGRSELMRRAARKLQRLTEIHPGCLVVCKPNGLAVHWRLAPHLEQIVLDHVSELASELGGDFRVQKDGSLVELLPAGTDKAKAISVFLNHSPFRGRRPIFIGGDLSDHPALELVRALGGFSVHVGPSPSVAEYAVENSVSVRKWLMNWGELGRSRRAAGEVNILQELR